MFSDLRYGFWQVHIGAVFFLNDSEISDKVDDVIGADTHPEALDFKYTQKKQTKVAD